MQDYLAALTPDQLSAVRGLGTRLAILTESHAGRSWRRRRPARHTIDLRRALEGSEVVVFSLNSSVYGKLAAQLGTLVVQDLITTVGQRLERAGGAAAPQALIGIDEFSAIGSDHLLALLARGREAGVAVLLATQELADLERAGPGFRDQVLGLTAVKLVHRQDVPSSARMVAEMIGTERVWEETRDDPGPVRPPHGGPRHPAPGRALRRRPERDQDAAHRPAGHAHQDPGGTGDARAGPSARARCAAAGGARRARAPRPRSRRPGSCRRVSRPRSPSATGRLGEAARSRRHVRCRTASAQRWPRARSAGRRGRGPVSRRHPERAGQPDPGVTR